MRSFAVTREYDVPPEVAFDVFTNSARYPDYTPIRRCVLEHQGREAPDGVGAVRALFAGPRPTRERVLEYEHPRRFGFEIVSGAPVRSYHGRLRFDPTGSGCRVTYEVELDPIVTGTGPAVAAGFRTAIELLMRIAGPEARRRQRADSS